MKTFGKMSIAFLYDDETGIIVNEPILESSEPNVPTDVLQRIYISLGMHLHLKSCNERYGDVYDDEIKEQHGELMQILEDEKCGK